ncbi:hypothetical protein [Vibrio mimicus]|uniref:Uncharacterized protein n=1 Tax=Vibrio mimicus TaxID=674 RepID=A0A2J9V3H7_VIBMI|nr:hypothetical protein [Vibrio mimicus]EEW09189.1 hypothetical protein VMD_33660 [Vibrio mimicus VM573]EGU18626.1 hypothetical protein SX4_3705 [Vibrio mimicus SX-4]KFE30590.1 hypothetical protein DN31_2687 [Vibrio mimicus]PNM58316.1 hypothetical protein AL544_020785 [Vibrio mimicus]TXZ74779.1 hypothetical protein FXE51_13960 [Vibrio mimicus]
MSLSWLEQLTDSGGELLNAVTGAGSSWLNGWVEHDISKKQSDLDAARQNQVEGQTADGQPLGNRLMQPTMNHWMAFGGLFLAFVLVVFLITQRKR